MGTSDAGVGRNAQKFIDEEFKRLCKKGRRHLVLEEVLKFHAKGATLPIEFCHLGVLWVLDRCGQAATWGVFAVLPPVPCPHSGSGPAQLPNLQYSRGSHLIFPFPAQQPRRQVHRRGALCHGGALPAAECAVPVI